MPASESGLRRVLREARAYAPAFVPSRLGPRNRFVVLGPGRCGSRLLLTLLRSQPGVRCDFEILNPRDNRVRYPFRWVQAHAMRSAAHGARTFGFKLLCHHIRDLPLVEGGNAFIDRLAEARYVIVVLTRNNLLRQAVSWERAQIIGRHHFMVGEQADDQKVNLDPAQLILRIGLLEAENDFARTAGKRHPHVEVSYEDDLLSSEHHQATADRIMAAFDLQAAPVRTRLQRGSPDELHAQVSNWDEIVDVIGRTRFADFLTG